MEKKSGFTYYGRQLKEISFPLGGIGTGCIGLGGDGRLIDWEIFNRPKQKSRNGFSHFAIKVEESDGKVIDARVLNGPLAPPYSGEITPDIYDGFGFGPARGSMAGVPHFEETTFRAAFPFAWIDFLHHSFPGKVTLKAFNPFIPNEDERSGIPAAMFEFTVENTTNRPLTYALIGALSNPLPAENVHHHVQQGNFNCLNLQSSAFDLTNQDLHMGDLTLAALAENVSVQEFWYRGNWFDALEVYWHDLNTTGDLKSRTYPVDKSGKGNTGAMMVRKTIQPGESTYFRFVIAWNFPNMHNFWNEGAQKKAQELGISNHWRNHYATQFVNSMHSAETALTQWDALESDSMRFTKALFDSTLPEEVLDAVSANLSILKSPTVLRLEDGTFYGFEGCHADTGCCEGSCTHVWNYTQALAFLFPALERSMRDANYEYNQTQAGGMRFRLALPLDLNADTFAPFRACVDGQFGDVLKTYRDWKLCGGDDWLAKHWPAVKASIEFAWSDDNPDHWDPEKSGVLTGRQHHTLDMEFFAPSSWLNGFYLGALKAGAEMALALGETETAREYQAIFEKGKVWTDQHLFNGEYYIQQIDLTDKTLLDNYSSDTLIADEGDLAAVYWDAEHGELKYQAAEGCGIDQLLAQWHADLYGLGEIFDQEQTRSALKALFTHNFISPLREHFNSNRLFALEDESGLSMFTWPANKRRPVIPIPYSSEMMTGFEYSAACLMIQYGWVEEGLQVVKAVRDRYDGEKRNPWNEIECGSNYARAMASYSLINVFSGFHFDLCEGFLGFDPVPAARPFVCLWSIGSAWGSVRFEEMAFSLSVLGGELQLNQLHLPAYAELSLAGEGDFSVTDGWVQWQETKLILAGETFYVKFE